MSDSSFASLFELLPIGAYRSTPAGVQLRANAALVRLNGYTSEAEMLRATGNLDDGWYVLPGRRDEFKALMAAHGQVTDFVSEIFRHKTRERIWVRETAHVVRDGHGEIQYYEGTVQDITAEVLATRTVAEQEARWRLALDAAGDGVWDWRIETGEEYCSDRLLQIFGFEPGELPDVAAALDERTHPEDVAHMRAARADHIAGRTPAYSNEHRVRCKDGRWKWVLSRGMVVERAADGRALRMLGTHTDIDERKRTEATIWRHAHFDALTGLPNRRMFRSRLDEVVQHTVSTGGTAAVALIDLDHFKEINDSLGHDSGDRLLMLAAERIVRAVGDAPIVARMGGDEFTVLWPNLGDAGTARERVRADLGVLLAQLAHVFELGAEEAYVSACIGVVICPVDGDSSELLLRHADQAMYAAKAAGRNRYRFFQPAMQEMAHTRARLEQELRKALAEHQLSVVYQPLLDVATGTVRKAEALLRWNHPVLGSVPPHLFIPVAESSGQIVAIGDWVLAQAQAQAARWRQQLGADFEISVNCSPVQFQHAAALPDGGTTGFSAVGAGVALEITEGLLMQGSDALAALMADLARRGIEVWLDDFGSGYSSLRYLHQMHIDGLKIDQSFVRDVQPGSAALALCKAMVVMAHELGMEVVAEGVETNVQFQLLKHAGCDWIQGYWVAPPLSTVDFEVFVQNWNAGAQDGAA